MPPRSPSAMFGNGEPAWEPKAAHNEIGLTGRTRPFDTTPPFLRWFQVGEERTTPDVKVVSAPKDCSV